MRAQAPGRQTGAGTDRCCRRMNGTTRIQHTAAGGHSCRTDTYINKKDTESERENQTWGEGRSVLRCMLRLCYKWGKPIDEKKGQ